MEECTILRLFSDYFLDTANQPVRDEKSAAQGARLFS
jgi:hypothetical protein